MSEPRISAIVPNYNHARYLPRSIGALLNQSVLPCEIIVVDDGSSDNSVEILDAFAKKNPVIKVLKNEKNLGAHASLDRAMALATGDYVTCYSADDEVRPGLFENAIKLLRQYPEAGLCSGMCEWRSTTSGLTWLKGTGMPNKPCYLSPDEMIELSKQGRLNINNQNAIFKRSALEGAGGWKKELRWCSDWFGGYVMGFRHGMCHIPEVLSNFYLYPNSYYNSPQAEAERYQVMIRLLDFLESEPYADVMPRIGASGLLGEFGWPMLRLVVGNRKHWHFFTTAFLRYEAKRTAEVIGKRFFPKWLASWCLKTFYGRG